MLFGPAEIFVGPHLRGQHASIKVRRFHELRLRDLALIAQDAASMHAC